MTNRCARFGHVWGHQPILQPCIRLGCNGARVAPRFAHTHPRIGNLLTTLLRYRP